MQEEVRRDDESSTDCIELTVKYLPGSLLRLPPLSRSADGLARVSVMAVKCTKSYKLKPWRSRGRRLRRACVCAAELSVSSMLGYRG